MGLRPTKAHEKTPYPASPLGHLLPQGEGWDDLPSPRGEGGGHAPPGEGVFDPAAACCTPKLRPLTQTVGLPFERLWVERNQG